MRHSFLILIASAAVACSADDNNGAHNNGHDHSAHDHGTKSDAHEHEHDAGPDGGHIHEGDSGHALPDLGERDFGPDVTISEAAESYCECLLITCHDPFHEKYGVDDADAIAACNAEASAYPVAGSPQMSGDSIECRSYHCENVGADITCEDALGAACM